MDFIVTTLNINIIIILIFFIIIYSRFIFPIIITFKKLDVKAKTPTKAYHKAVCWDFYSIEDAVIAPGQWSEFRTGIAYAPWPHFYFKKLNLTFTPLGNIASKIHTRSGMATKKGLRLHLGVIDNDFRGEITIWIFNHSDRFKRIHIGDKIAQVEFFRVPQSYMIEVKELSKSLRNINGFGSSGS
jgi:dUTP pyrophosphatase